MSGECTKKVMQFDMRFKRNEGLFLKNLIFIFKNWVKQTRPKLGKKRIKIGLLFQQPFCSGAKLVTFKNALIMFPLWKEFAYLSEVK